jgi:MoaA/NifB/PqqE/SkfB family radical SAM enzyme
MKQLIYLGFWYIKARFFGRKRPLQTVLFITDECNLSCKHCAVYNHAQPRRKTYKEIEDELRYSHRLGSRFVDFEGGEPMMWNDGQYNINDLIDLAKEIGFFSTTVTTNAQFPFTDLKADSIWVSLDGLGAYHDEIRGKGVFERLCKNIAESKQKALSVNMVINSKNYNSVEETIRFTKENPHIHSISLNFYTPSSLAPDPLFLDWDKRKEIIDLIIGMKKAGYPVMNSVSGLKKMKTNNFKKYCWITNFILPDKTRVEGCPLEALNICENCGYCMAGEMACVFHLKPDTIFSALKLRMRL